MIGVWRRYRGDSCWTCYSCVKLGSFYLCFLFVCLLVFCIDQRCASFIVLPFLWFFNRSSLACCGHDSPALWRRRRVRSITCSFARQDLWVVITIGRNASAARVHWLVKKNKSEPDKSARFRWCPARAGSLYTGAASRRGHNDSNG